MRGSREGSGCVAGGSRLWQAERHAESGGGHPVATTNAEQPGDLACAGRLVGGTTGEAEGLTGRGPQVDRRLIFRIGKVGHVVILLRVMSF